MPKGPCEYARWKSVSQIFDFVLNTLCVDALKDDPNCWRSRLLAGRLLLEKYNRAQGVPELQKGLAVNPQSAELLTTLGRAAAQDFDWDEARDYANQALAVNSHWPEALRLKAEADLQDGDLAGAQAALDEAAKWNSVDQETAALQADLALQQDGLPDLETLRKFLKQIGLINRLKLEKPTRFEQIVIAVAQRNPKPGAFLSKLGSRLANQRKHPAAEVVYLQAVEIMPQLSQPKTELGLLYMQTGRTQAARKLLDAAFKSDPFHVRVSNMRKVLNVLDEYDTVTTDHFVIRADTTIDKVLARYMAEYLEQIYPELTAQFGYEPPQRTQIEVYNEAKGLSAHQWFSARMIGLPWIQTIGASTGVIIAMASPTGLEQPMNWARVLKHELVHVITLQQTDFHIPHWYTEALAVRSEGYSRPADWNRLLLERVPQGRLRNLDNLNLGFQRAGSRDDWNFAYCQSALYAEYMVERFGPDALAKLLDAYRRRLSTDDAITDCFSVTKSDFESGYRDYLVKIVSGLVAVEAEPRMTPAEIARAYEEDSSDPTIAGRYAQLLLLQKRADEAREIAVAVLEQEPKEPHAALVLSFLAREADDKPEAARILQQALEESKPYRRLLEQLADLLVDLENYAEADRLYDLGRSRFPDDSDWWKGNVITSRKLGNIPKLKQLLETLCDKEYDDAAFPLERAELAFADGDFAMAKSFGIKALQIDVLNVKIHTLLGKSNLKLNEYESAAREFQVALELKPGDPNLQAELAECYLNLGRTDAAKELLDSILSEHPDHAAARAVKEKIKS
ncbi:MAG: tetratricopeptide repeat protein [Planctomycetaceae bacterium]